jgi:hypothetical protein
MKKKTLSVLAGIAALGALAIPAAAEAASPTSISISFVDRTNVDVFKGKVGSPDANCISNRRVKLFMVAPGKDLGLGRDRSEDNGSWSIDVEGGAAPGQYYAKAVASTQCAGAVSPTITVP